MSAATAASLHPTTPTVWTLLAMLVLAVGLYRDAEQPLASGASKSDVPLGGVQRTVQ